MSKDNRTQYSIHIDNMLVIGCGLTAIYWTLASIIVAMSPGGGSLLQGLIGLDRSDILMRILVICFFMIFGSHAQFTIAQRRRAEQALQASEEKYGTIINDIEDGYYEVNTQGRMIFVNDALLRITGYDRSELLENNIRGYLAEGEFGKLEETFERVSVTQQAEKDRDFILKRKDGAACFVEASVSAVKNAANETIGFRGIIRDVTKRKQTEALRQEKLAAEAASRSKSEFLANMSHEIRTPLNSIIGLVELLLSSRLSGDQREDLEVVRSASYALLSVINDILDFSKIEAGKLELETINFELRHFLGDVLKMMAVKAHEKGLEIAYEVDPALPDRIQGDTVRFRQVLLNLIGNAIKFTDSGEVVVTVSKEDASEGNLHLHVAVRDTGIGIRKEKQGTVFNAFEQEDGSTSRKYGGTGLGLAVSAQLVDLMGGDIWLESSPGGGSIFHFTAVFELQAGAAEPVQTAAGEMDIRGLRVLVVDDNDTNRRIISGMLENWQMFPVPAAGLNQAVQIYHQKTNSSIPFDCVIVDSNLPGLENGSLARLLGAKQAAPLRIIAMQTTSSDRKRMRPAEGETVATVTKPVRPSDLLDAFVKVFGLWEWSSSAKDSISQAPAADSAKGLEILVAEDTPFNQKFIRRLLQGWGHKETIVGDGKSAIDILQEKNFDLILMDVQMPQMDGIEATLRIREMEKAEGRRHTPVIAMTAHAMKGDRERCVSAGMDDYISKPISAQKLREVIENLISRVGRISRPSAENHRSNGELDGQRLLEAFGNDKALFKEIAGIYCNDYPAMLTDLQDSLAKKDTEALKCSAHAIKGMARNFLAEKAASAAEDIEAMVETEDYENMAKRLAVLSDELVRLERQLRAFIDEKR